MESSRRTVTNHVLHGLVLVPTTAVVTVRAAVSCETPDGCCVLRVSYTINYRVLIYRVERKGFRDYQSVLYETDIFKRSVPRANSTHSKVWPISDPTAFAKLECNI